MSLSFYYVSADYVRYLQAEETNQRGFTHVPNVEYSQSHNQKFVLGIILEMNGFDYYVPVSSYSIKRSDNILINIDSDTVNPIKGSIRFNYMFPIPKGLAKELIIKNESNSGRRSLLNKEWKFCIENEVKIRNKARQTYSKVINRVNESVAKNSCDFRLLEQACQTYINKQIDITKE
ncbi:type III toxin-antitoxin system ToxN/AbiQ family toxin [Niameybacter massiliensis]|uniref:type III toxin-antitoxin system ToxN/AbiQ family toxin n=1 Tax=Niameybacter massiliensis TaxID=1658108 RepID=UPI0006B61B8E|nr:type III toxin-antitoxin system ToxN/AbiQ family toxin [Niameybacter massiliensis]